MSLIFYSRSNCPLCDHAEALLDTAGLASQVEHVDIDTDLALIRRYGDRVPVVLNPRTGENLAWPFTASQVKRLLEGD